MEEKTLSEKNFDLMQKIGIFTVKKNTKKKIENQFLNLEILNNYLGSNKEEIYKIEYKSLFETFEFIILTYGVYAQVFKTTIDNKNQEPIYYMPEIGNGFSMVNRKEKLKQNRIFQKFLLKLDSLGFSIK